MVRKFKASRVPNSSKKREDVSFEQGSSSVSDQSDFSSVMSCLRARNSRDVCERMGVLEDRYAVLSWSLSHTGTRGWVEDSHDLDYEVTICEIPGVQRSWFRWRCTRNVDTVTKRTTSTTTSRQRGIYASIIALVSLCFPTISIDRLQVQCKPLASQLITARSRDRSPRSREHMPAIALDRHRHFLDRAVFG